MLCDWVKSKYNHDVIRGVTNDLFPKFNDVLAKPAVEDEKGFYLNSFGD